MEAVSFHDKMKLPPYKIDILPNAVFQFNAAKSLGGTNVYTQKQLQVLDRNWIVHKCNCGSTVNTDDLVRVFCHPAVWMALVYGASPLQPNIDACTLEANGKTNTLALSQARADSSINFKNFTLKTDIIDTFKRSNTMTTEEQVQEKESNPRIGLSDKNIAKRMKIG